MIYCYLEVNFIPILTKCQLSYLRLILTVYMYDVDLGEKIPFGQLSSLTR